MSLAAAYKFFRSLGGGIVGESAVGAIQLARAELEAERRGWVVSLEEEIERYEDVYGDPPPPNTEYVCVALKEEDGSWIGSLGFVEADDSNLHPSRRSATC